MDPPVNLRVISITHSLIHFVWSPPFTLRISEDNSETEYEVTITTTANGNDTLSDIVMEPEYIYHRRDYMHCGKIAFQVAAINRVGKGNKSNVIEAGFFGCKHRLLCKSLCTVLSKSLTRKYQCLCKYNFHYRAYLYSQCYKINMVLH